MTIDLAEEHIMVTGANRGIGLAITRQLLQSGAKVSAHCRRSSEELNDLLGSFSSKLKLVHAELQDLDAVSRLLSTAIDHFGTISGIVLNAGIAESSPIQNNDWEEVWLNTLNVNLTVPALISKNALLHFKEHGGGRLLFISSRAAFRGDTPDYLAYAASKGGLVSLHRSIARGFGKHGIKSFLIAPGFVETDMAKEFVDQYGKDYIRNDMALNNLTQPEDIASFTTFLMSGKADHSTGATFDINAGSYVH